mgnify:CR=1 FL=1
MENLIKSRKYNLDSEKNIKKIINNLEIGAGLFDSEGYLLNINNKCLKIFGIQKKPANLKKIHFLKVPNLPAPLKAKLKNQEIVKFKESIDLKKLKKTTGLEITKSGTITCKITLMPLELNDKITIYLFQLRDITNQAKIKEKLKKSERKYHSLFVNMTPGFAYHKMIYDSQGQPIDYKFLEVNPAFEELTGLRASEIIGRRATVILSGIKDDLVEWIKNFEEVTTSKKPIVFETYSEPLKRWYQVSAYSSQKVFFGTTFIDITKHKQIEEKYRGLFEKSPLLILLIDEGGTIIDVNPIFQKTFEKSRDSMKGQDLRDVHIFNPELVNNILTGDIQTPKDIRVRLKDSSTWYRLNVSLIETSNRKILQIIMEDISNEKIFEDLNKELNQTFLNFTDNSEHNISLLLQSCNKLFNADLTVYACKIQKEEDVEYFIITNKNKNKRRIVDLKDNFLVNTYFKLEVPFPTYFSNLKKMYPNDKFIKENEVKASFGRLINLKYGSKGILCSFFKKDFLPASRENIVLSLTSVALKNEFKQWKLKCKLEQQSQQLKEINRFKDTLISRMSHELKTPLISIKGFSELFIQKYSEEVNKKMLSIIKEIQKGAERLEHLVGNLLKTSKLQNEKISLNKRWVNLGDVVKRCVKGLEAVRERRGHDIMAKLNKEMNTFLDEEKIFQVFSNILLNALNYTPKGGLIEISSQVKDDYYLITFQDNGIGFTEKEKKRVFKQFGKIERYGEGLDLDSEGSGLGLYISKQIIELHNGEIWLESEGKGKGSTFFVSLPIIKEI